MHTKCTLSAIVARVARKLSARASKGILHTRIVPVITDIFIEFMGHRVLGDYSL